jgi:hypothetical protein
MATDPGTSRLRNFLVECYVPGVHADEVAAAGDRARAASEGLQRAGSQVEYVRALLVPLDEVVFHLFLAQDAGLVREVAARAALAYERIVESMVVEMTATALPVSPDRRP